MEPIHFNAIRFANTVLYDNDTIVYQNAVGINTTIVNNDYLFSVNGNALINGSITASNLIYGISNLSNIEVSAIDLYQGGVNDFIQFQNHPLFFNEHGNLGIGTTIAYRPLTLYGTLYARDLTFLDGYNNTNEYFYTKTTREIFFINDQDVSSFLVTLPGSNIIDSATDVTVHFSGLKLSSSNEFYTDYSVSNVFKNDVTECHVLFNRPAFPVNIVEISISPQKPYTGFPVFTKQTIAYSPWDASNQSIYTNTYAVSIGSTTPPQHTQLNVTRTTYASNLIVTNLTALDVIDESITTSNLTCASQLSTTTLNIHQPLTIQNGQVHFYNASVQLGSNARISPTSFNCNIDLPYATLSFPPTANVGIGTRTPRTTLDIQGDIHTQSFSNTIPSQWTTSLNNIYIPSQVTILPPTSNLHFPHSLSILANATTSNLSINGRDTPSTAYINGDLYTDQLIAPTFTGMIAHFAGSNPQPGWLECNGSYQLIATYPELYSVLGTSYGPLSGASFKLPDLRGEFLRGNTSTNPVGTIQSFAMQSHTHIFNHATLSLPINTTSNNTLTLTPGIVTNATSNVLNATTANETRPRNMALLPCIKT